MNRIPRGSLRLLLVEDDAEDAQIFARRCPSHLRVEHVTNPVEALERLRAASCDVAFVDYRLGAESGLELIRTARAQGARVPLILITGQELDALGENALLAGATDFLPKDAIAAESLERTVRWALIRRHVENRLQSEAAQDALTRLPGRAVFNSEGERLVRRARGRGQPLYLILVEMPGIERVGRVLGRQAGERAILALAEAARHTAQAWDLCARTGAGEIAVLLLGANAAQAAAQATTIVSTALARVAPPAAAGGIGGAALASLGIGVRSAVAALEAQDTGLRTLVERADAALAMRALQCPPVANTA